MELEQIDLVYTGGAVIVRLRGKLGLRMEAAEIAINRVAAQRPQLAVIDLSGLRFLSSIAMGLLVQLRHGMIAHGGVVKLAGPSGLVHDALRRTRLIDLFEICDTVDEAIASEPPVAVFA